jgi:hypothetical protein
MCHRANFIFILGAADVTEVDSLTDLLRAPAVIGSRQNGQTAAAENTPLPQFAQRMFSTI